jgi:hypothetical protein
LLATFVRQEMIVREVSCVTADKNDVILGSASSWCVIRRIHRRVAKRVSAVRLASCQSVAMTAIINGIMSCNNSVYNGRVPDIRPRGAVRRWRRMVWNSVFRAIWPEMVSWRHMHEVMVTSAK